MVCQKTINAGLVNLLDSLDLKSVAKNLLGFTDDEIIKDLDFGMMKSKIFDFIKEKESSQLKMWSYKWFLSDIGIEIVNTYGENKNRSYIKAEVVNVDSEKVREYLRLF